MDGSGREHCRLRRLGGLDSVHFVYSVHLCPLHSGVQNWSVIWAWARRTSCSVTTPVGGPSGSATSTNRCAVSVTMRFTASLIELFGEAVWAGCGAT